MHGCLSRPVYFSIPFDCDNAQAETESFGRFVEPFGEFRISGQRLERGHLSLLQNYGEPNSQRIQILRCSGTAKQRQNPLRDGRS